MGYLDVIYGQVIVGNKRGKGLGFPTANVHIARDLEEGIYISETEVDNQKYHSLTFIGVAETFDEVVYLSETHILDFDQDIYYKMIKVSLIKKIRDNQKFTSVNDLITEMKKDEVVTREYFFNN